MGKNSDAFSVNERVSHETYGLGTIREIALGRTTIEFDTEGRRKFVTSLVQLERSTAAAPETATKKARSKKAGAKAKK